MSPPKAGPPRAGRALLLPSFNQVNYFTNKKTEYNVQAPAYFCLAAIIGAEKLNCRVRDGNGCGLLARGTLDTVLSLILRFFN